MRRRTTVAVAAAAAAALALAGCGDDDEPGGGSDGSGAIEVELGSRPASVRLDRTECAHVADNQVIASGIVRNDGEHEQNVSIVVRFLDAEGVRVDYSSDSVSILQAGESARWDVSLYPTGAEDVTSCEVSVSG